MHAENADLRSIENGCGEQRTEDAAIGDRKGTALKLRQGELVVARALRKVRNLALDLREGLAVGLAQDRHHETLFRTHGNANIVIVLQNHLIALYFGIQAWIGFERADHGFGEERHKAEGDIVALLE